MFWDVFTGMFFKCFLSFFAFTGQHSRKRQEMGNGGITCRKGTLDAGIKPGPPTVRTVASTHGAVALPVELNIYGNVEGLFGPVEMHVAMVSLALSSGCFNF